MMIFLLSMLLTQSLQSPWQRLPSLPDREGLAGPLAGVSHGKLFIVGGANFPGKKPWEGGTKKWHDAVYVLNDPKGTWKQIEPLPRPWAYGISLTYGQSIIAMGGSTDQEHLSEVVRLEWKDGRLQRFTLPSLPITLAYGCGAIVGDILYVAGGQEKPDSPRALHRFFALNLKEPRAWKELPAWPGAGRMLAYAASVGDTFYLIGGVELIGDTKPATRRYLKDGYRYSPASGWQQLPDLPVALAAGPTPAPSTATSFVLLGGDDGTQIGKPPEHHPGFNRSPLRYDVKQQQWKLIDQAEVARATLPAVPWQGRWVLPNGEVRPGIRSPEVWWWLTSAKE